MLWMAYISTPVQTLYTTINALESLYKPVKCTHMSATEMRRSKIHILPLMAKAHKTYTAFKKSLFAYRIINPTILSVPCFIPNRIIAFFVNKNTTKYICRLV